MVTEAEKEGAVYVLPAGSDGYEEILSEDEKEFRQFKEEMGDASTYAKILVARRPIDAYGNTVGRNTFQLFECGLTDYTFSQLFSRIRDQHGTGLYQIQGRDKEGKIRFNKTIGIEAPKDPNSKNNPESIAGVMSEMRQAMMEQQQRTEQLVKNFQPQSQGGSMVEMLTGIALLMKELRPDTPPVVPPKSTIEVLTEMKLVKELIGDIGGGESGGVETFWGAIAEAAKSFGGPLMQAVALAQQQGQVDDKGVIQLPAPEAETPEPQPEKENPTEVDAMNLEQMKEQLAFLITQAKAQVDVAIVVEFILDKLPETDEAYNSLEQFLMNENCVHECAMINPEVREYTTWFEQWRLAMLAELDKMAIDENEDLTTTPENAEDAETKAGDSEPEALDDASKPAAADTVNSDGDSKRPPGNVPDP